MLLSPPSKTKSYRRIKDAIKAYVAEHSTLWVNYRNWYVGITNHPPTRHEGHAKKLGCKPKFWKHWNAGSFRIARTLETKFHKLGMRETNLLGGATEDSKYIYIYKISPTILD